jgi:hypothetical protein
MDTTRPIWFPAQVAVDAQTDFRIILEGQATNGGFAVDDLMFSPGSCSSEYFPGISPMLTHSLNVLVKLTQLSISFQLDLQMLQ